MTAPTETQDGALAAPSLPDSVLAYLHAYGDSRADDDGMSGNRICEAILSIRRWAGAAILADRAARADGWVSVESQLPPKNTEVLVAFEGISIPSTGQYTASVHDHHGWCYPSENRSCCDDGGDPIVTHWMPLPPHPGDAAPGSTAAALLALPSDAQLDQALRERDNYHEWADRLADQIARLTGADIGEHSSENNPWARAAQAAQDSAHASPPRVEPSIHRLVESMVPAEQAAFELWLHQTRTSGDAESVDLQWLDSSVYAGVIDELDAASATQGGKP